MLTLKEAQRTAKLVKHWLENKELPSKQLKDIEISVVGCCGYADKGRPIKIDCSASVKAKAYGGRKLRK